MMWSLGLNRNSKLFEAEFAGPIQTGADVKGLRALFVADPFLVVAPDVWYIFTEVLNNDCQKGEVGYHVSIDSGRTWSFGGIVLSEDWHLSFPFVVLHEGRYHMVTCATAGYGKSQPLWLYSTDNFPFNWSRSTRLLRSGQLIGHAVDPVMKLHRGVWYLFLLDDGIDKERLFYSQSLYGSFEEHRKSGIYTIRQSGQIVTDHGTGNMWAFHHTGSTVERWKISQLSVEEYEYGEREPLLGPRSDRWASSGMHTFNAVELGNGQWATVVDGWWDDSKHETFRCLRKQVAGESCQRVGSPAESP